MRHPLLCAIFGTATLFLLTGCGGSSSSSAPTVTSPPPPPPPAANNAPTVSNANGTQSGQIVSAATTSSDKPNIIFIISDDQGLDASPQYSLSSDLPETPNLTAIANSGLIFDNAWVSPTCSPTRAALMTGKHSNRTSVFAPGDELPASEIILQSYLKNHADTSEYASAVIGKWHLGSGNSGPNDFGIDHFAGMPTGLHNRSLSGTDADIAANPRPYYLAAIEAMDTEFGRLWDSLSTAEQSNTIIIYLGDNGTPRQVKDNSVAQTGSKDTLYQGGVNVPMFISGPAVTRTGERESALISHTDFFPTIAELSGANLPAYQDGRSFADLLSDASSATREDTYTESNDGWTARNDSFKLINNTGGTQELYDLNADPAEQTNLLNSSGDYTATVAALTSAANANSNEINITGASFSNPSAKCADYVGQYVSTATDISRNISFRGSVSIEEPVVRCTISSNSIPNHCLNVGDERTGCNAQDQPFRFDPMHAPNGFNIDSNNAHTQSNGAYHYHGPPPITSGNATQISGLVGFAADGFPIFGPWFNDGTTIRTAQYPRLFYRYA